LTTILLEGTLIYVIQTVIFDCCHSGHLTRDEQSDPTLLVRQVKTKIKVPPNLDEDIWGTKIAPTAFGFRGLGSHVLLAACGAAENAFEEDEMGVFTRALLELLKKPVTDGMDKVTYADIVQRIPYSSR
jgi:Caspase domain